MKKIIIATAHSKHFEKEDEKIEITLQGYSPCFQYLWIDDVLYTLYKTNKRVKIEKTK